MGGRGRGLLRATFPVGATLQVVLIQGVTKAFKISLELTEKAASISWEFVIQFLGAL